ncbi:MAG TPA: hypothetical protein VEB21_01435 [Terriglobales bacterium]|nr:hypothetical protein [Terriglobales bacterium]
MHWLIVVPYYFFTALTLSALLILTARLLRLKVAVNTLVTGAVITALIGMILVLSSDAVSVADLTGRGILCLGIASFVLAGLDATLMKSLPHSIDHELDFEV